jgi:hypothetical protein
MVFQSMSLFMGMSFNPCLSIHVFIVFNHGHCVVHSHFCSARVAMKCNLCTKLADFRARPVGEISAEPFKWFCQSCYAKMEMDPNFVEHDVQCPPLCCDCGEAPADMRIQSADIEQLSGYICKYWCYACQSSTDAYDGVPHTIYDLDSASESDEQDESVHEAGDTAAHQQQPDSIKSNMQELEALHEQLQLESALAQSQHELLLLHQTAGSSSSSAAAPTAPALQKKGLPSGSKKVQRWPLSDFIGTQRGSSSSSATAAPAAPVLQNQRLPMGSSSSSSSSSSNHQPRWPYHLG